MWNKKSKEIISYIVFGGFTTVINFIIYLVCTRIFTMDKMLSTAIAWFFSVLFAYITNKLFVFNAKTDTFYKTIAECAKFFAGRLSTGLLDEAFILVFAEMLHFNDILVKMITTVIVIVANYVISKLYIFKGGTSD